uniref:DUF1618 domain-containing protein n=1 Tax=Leersia perrieri TaxID=77586 RepID=A0A0D9VQ35_9ORYZ
MPQEAEEEEWDKVVLRDSYLLSYIHMDNVPPEKDICCWQRWRAVIWSRTISSTSWCKECILDVDNIILPDERSLLRFRDLFSVFPTLIFDDGRDLLYLKITVRFKDIDGQVATVDLGKNELELGSYETAVS